MGLQIISVEKVNKFNKKFWEMIVESDWMGANKCHAWEAVWDNWLEDEVKVTILFLSFDRCGNMEITEDGWSVLLWDCKPPTSVH
jgi:hypothetical protein